MSPIHSQGYMGHYSSAHCTTTYQEVCHTSLEQECDCSHPLQVGAGAQVCPEASPVCNVVYEERCGPKEHQQEHQQEQEQEQEQEQDCLVVEQKKCSLVQDEKCETPYSQAHGDTPALLS